MPPKKNPVKIAIVDDHKLFRKGLINLITSTDDEAYMIIFEAENGDGMIKKIDNKVLPDIVILDIEMPYMNGYETVAWLRNNYPEIKVLVISLVENEEAIVRMVKMGVRGYLSKDVEPEDVYNALRSITNKGYYYTDFFTGKLIYSLQNEHGPDNKDPFNHKIWNELNERHRQFLKLACTEKTYDEIAKEMCLSPKTIDGYREIVFEKFGVKTRVGMVLFAIKAGLVTI